MTADHTALSPSSQDWASVPSKLWRDWQTNSNQSLPGQSYCPLCRAKAAPLGESSGAVRLDEVSAGEAAFLDEVV